MPCANSAASAVSSCLPKWQLAIAFGAPVALGLGYMYYKNSIHGKSDGSRKTNGADKHISIDCDSPGITSTSDKSEIPGGRARKQKFLGNAAFGARKYDDAILYYNQAIEACPLEDKDELAKCYQNRAAAYEALDKFTAVREDCTKALELNPKYTKALIRRAKVLEKINALELALEDITAVCILERFSNQNTLLTADRVLKQLGKQHAQELMATKKPVMPSKHFVKTYFSSFRNDPVLAADAIDSLSQDENRGLGKAIKAFKEERYDDIIPVCTAEIEKRDADISHATKLLLLRATFFLLLGQHEKALRDLDAVLTDESTPRDVQVNALIKRATMHMQLENPLQCFEDFTMAVAIDPDSADIYHHRGQVNLLLEKVNEAREDSERALKLNPTFGIAYAQKCYIDYRHAVLSKRPSFIESAMENFEKSFQLFPECCECYTLYAQTLCDAQSYEKADEYFAKAIEKEPKNATIYVHRGLLQLQWSGNVVKAMEYINKALEMDDKCEFGYETLGTIEVQRGNLEEAIKLFDNALSLARTTLELSHIFSLQDAAKAQLKMRDRLGAEVMCGIPGMSQ